MAAALLALLMLSYASVRSTVMLAQMAQTVAPAEVPDGGAASGAMSGMGMGMATPTAMPVRPQRSEPKSSNPAACPYCSVAAHLPILGSAELIRVPAAFTFAAFRAIAVHGPRGPPDRQPRARGPPPILSL